MLGKSNDPNDSQTSGVLIQYLREISVYLKEINISKKNDHTGSSGFSACRTFGRTLQGGRNHFAHQF